MSVPSSDQLIGDLRADAIWAKTFLAGIDGFQRLARMGGMPTRLVNESAGTCMAGG